jgi:ubiquinol-cytochrome c reductase iron-sulfur subunit
MVESSTRNSEPARRRFIGSALALVLATGVTLSSIPFVRSLLPSRSRQIAGAPIEVDLDTIRPGEQILVTWRGKPIWILRRTSEMIQRLRKSDFEARLRDPLSQQDQQPPYARNDLRSIHPDILVVIATCTHLGCIPKFHPETGQMGFASEWPGGYFCPCHASKFDLTGRVFKGVPAPLNLVIPPHRFTDHSSVIIGEDPVV